MSVILQCEQIAKSYGQGTKLTPVLRSVSVEFRRHETTMLLGPSGSGKTTLLSIMGCLLTPSAGQIKIDGQQINFKNHRQLTSVRRTKLGFVFQHSQLLPFMSVAENLRLVGKNAGMKTKVIYDGIQKLADQLGISELLRRRPGDLSGGQRQRVSIARALLHQPAVILADEPTAALDWENGSSAMQLLVDQAKERGAALITVTHDTRLIGMFDRVLTVSQGEVNRR